MFLKKTLAASLSFVSRMCSHYAEKIAQRESKFFGKTQCLVASSLFMYKSLVPYRISVQKMNAILPTKGELYFKKCRRMNIGFIFYATKTIKTYFENLRALSSQFIVDVYLQFLLLCQKIINHIFNSNYLYIRNI